MRSSDFELAGVWAESRVEAYVDGDLPPDEAARFEQLLVVDAALQREVEEALRLQDALHGLPRLDCPPAVAQAVLAEVRRRTEQSWAHRARAWLARLERDLAGGLAQLWQPALAMATLLLVVVSAALFGGRPQETMPDDVAVAQALEEVKWTLAYLTEVGRQTGESVRQDVLQEHVSVPVQHVLDRFQAERPQ